MEKILIDGYALAIAANAEHQHHDLILSYFEKEYDMYITNFTTRDYFYEAYSSGLEKSFTWSFYKEIKKLCKYLPQSESSQKQFEILLLEYMPKPDKMFQLEILSTMRANSISNLLSVRYKDFDFTREINLLPQL